MNAPMPATEDLIYVVDDGIARLTFNRPQARNALTFAMPSPWRRLIFPDVPWLIPSVFMPELAAGSTQSRMSQGGHQQKPVVGH